MKQKILSPTTGRLKLSPVILLIIIGIMLVSAGCQKEDEPEFSGSVEGYIVGSFIGVIINSETGGSTGIKTERGYCILVKGKDGSENKFEIDFYTFDLPSDLFDFSEEILSSTYNSDNCGPVFFPDSIIDKSIISFQYKIMDREEKVKFGFDGACYHMHQWFPWNSYNEIILKNTFSIIKQ
ncbi:MAG: hypothetical protein L3J54_04600 [Draconibacterium sp.]|nr:hypothetical protein [Draconibacterium sp.]